MLKVHALFPKHPTSCQVAIQTESPNNLSNIQYSSQVFKNCKLRDSLKQSTVENQIPSLNQSYSTYEFKKLTKLRNFRISKKENVEGSDHKAKIEATKFNFIKFEDKLLHQAIKKYIKKVPITKVQHLELNKQIRLVYFIEEQQQENIIFRRINVLQRESYSVMASIKEIVENIVTLSSVEKDPKGHIQQSQIKKIQWKVEKIIAMKQPIRVAKVQNEQTMPLNVKTILENYLRSNASQQVKPVFNKKGYLQRFYEEIFMRYENTPFNQQFQEGNIHISAPESQNNRSKSNRNSINSRGRPSNLNVFTPKSSLFCSQKINKFQNNLRKQIRNLAEQSQKIVVDQNKKVSKF